MSNQNSSSIFSNNDWLEQVYEITGKNPSNWLKSAKSLRICANLILNQLKRMESSNPPKSSEMVEREAYFQTYFMLAGLAIENLLKGIIVLKEPGRVTLSELDKTNWGNGHRFGLLIQTLDNTHGIKFNFNKQQNNLLNKLEFFITWAGRYPIPMSSEKYKKFIDSNNYIVIDDDPSSIEEIFRLLEEKLRNLINDESI